MALTLVKGDDELVSLRDIKVPEHFYDRIRTEVEALDLVFGGDKTPGILRGSCTMVTGVPGAGKSTLMLQLSDWLSTRAELSLLYNANEESREMVKLAADRVGIKGEFKISSKLEVDRLIAYVRSTKTEALVQDSLQTIGDRQLSGQRLLKSVCRKLFRLSKDHGVTVFFVGQVTKSGTAAGPMALVHEVDTHIHLSSDPTGTSRVIAAQKNRFGPSMVPFEFVLSGTGVEFRAVDPAAVVVAVQPISRHADKRGEVQRMIRDRLLAGESISGYCFERLNVDCSGGYWRGMLRLAVEQLKREGHSVGEKRIGGRLHSFVDRTEGPAAVRKVFDELGISRRGS
jgi:KaiC/GvpD/RAD55 family RecA-like ATPase